MKQLDFNKLTQTIGYAFKDNKLIVTALTHSSFANENGVESYERLEFLGDAVLQIVVSDYLYHFTQFDAGHLTKGRANLVSSTTLASIVKSWHIEEFLLLGHSMGAELSQKKYCDYFESVLGAVYLDGGMDNAIQFVKRHILDNHNIDFVDQDYKTMLQEQVGAENIKYVVLGKTGEAHDPTFTIKLSVVGIDDIVVTAGSIQEGQKQCAKLALNVLKEK